MRDGIDVSAYQHDRGALIDYQAVREAGYTWVARKVNEGRGNVDQWLRMDVNGFTAVGCEVLLYHFARPADANPNDDAMGFASVCTIVGPSLARIIDVEDTGGKSWGAVAAWVQTFIATADVTVIYVNRNYRSHLAPFGFPWGCDVWLADPDDPNDLEGCYAVQYGTVDVPGIESPCDVNHIADAPAPAPEPPEADDMNATQVVLAIEALYRMAGNTDGPGQLEWCNEIFAKPADQWAGSVAYVAHLLGHPGG